MRRRTVYVYSVTMTIAPGLVPGCDGWAMFCFAYDRPRNRRYTSTYHAG